MATEAVEQPQEQENPRSSKKMLMIVAVLVLLLAGGGAGAYFKFFHKAGGESPAAEEKKVSEQVIQDIETFLVNLADPGGKRFLKVTMKAKLDSPKLEEEFKSRVFELRDAILMILTSKGVDELSTAEDKAALKKEIVASLNKGLHKGQVLDLYFTEFLIQ